MPFIEDQLRRAIDETVDRGIEWCVTLESKRDPDKWIQLTCMHVNLHYPHNDDPLTRLAPIGLPHDSLELESWESNKSVTFSHAAESIPEIAAFVMRYLEVVL